MLPFSFSAAVTEAAVTADLLIGVPSFAGVLLQRLNEGVLAVPCVPLLPPLPGVDVAVASSGLFRGVMMELIIAFMVAAVVAGYTPRETSWNRSAGFLFVEGTCNLTLLQTMICNGQLLINGPCCVTAVSKQLT